jgi:hypothetical protein
MSLEQIDTETLYDRKELAQLSFKQLCSLLSLTKEHIKELRYTKDNLIEMVLNQFV